MMDLKMLSAYVEEQEVISVKMQYTFDINPYEERLRVNWREFDNDGHSDINEHTSGEVAWWYSDLLMFFNDENLIK